MSSTTFLIFVLEAAALGVWVAIGFPQVGPQRVPTALVTVAGALLLFYLTPSLVAAVGSWGGSSAARAAAAVTVMPALAAVVWAAACVLRSLVQLLNPLGSHSPT